MKKGTTITDIAQKLNITPATVSRALSDHPDIAAKTKKKVREMAVRMDYRPNKIASSLRSGKTKIIGVLIPSAEHVFFGSVIHGISNIASDKGYDVIIYQSNESQAFEKKGIDAFINARVDGILVSIAKDTVDFSHFINARKKNIPIAFFDRVNDMIGISSVCINDFKGAFFAAEALIKAGYQKIAHIAGPQHLKTFSERARGYKAALQEYAMPVNQDYIYQGDFSISTGRAAVRHFLSLNDPPDAIQGLDDFTALGALKELSEQNIKVPEEFGVFGFGEHITPSLSTIDQQTVLMGQKAFELIHRLIDNEAERKDMLQIILDPILIIRDSSRQKA
jgi:LacI family transcriptional regulator